MTLTLPQRRSSPTRDDFVAAVSASFQLLWQRYQAEHVTHSLPAWADAADAFNVSMMLDVARGGADVHGISSIIKHAIEMSKKEIGRIARVERDGCWIVYFEAR